jgi:hypothetical protein
MNPQSESQGTPETTNSQPASAHSSANNSAPSSSPAPIAAPATQHVNLVAQIPKASVLFKQAVNYYTKNFALIGGIFALPFVFTVMQVLEIIPDLDFLWVLLSGITGYVATIAFIYAITRSEEVKPDFMKAYSGSLVYLLPALWIGVLIFFTQIGGVALFIVPGIIVSILLSLSLYAFFVENLRGLNALVKSWHCVSGYWFAVLGRFLFLAVIAFIPLILITVLSVPFGKFEVNPLTEKANWTMPEFFVLVNDAINVFVLGPVFAIFALSIFKSLSAIKGELSSERAAAIRKKILVLMIIGIVAAVLFLVLGGLVIWWVIQQFIMLPGIQSTASVLPAFNSLFNPVK